MAYISLYRKYRPKKFSDVVGQDIVVKILKNSIIEKKIGHAYIFAGPRGIGKTSIAKIFSKAVNCLDPIDGDLCGKCESCIIDINNDIVFIKDKKPFIPIVKSVIYRRLKRTEISISEHGDHHTEHRDRHDKDNGIITAKQSYSLHDQFNAHGPDSCDHVTDPFFLQICTARIPDHTHDKKPEKYCCQMRIM